VAGGHARRRAEHHLGTGQHDRVAVHATRVVRRAAVNLELTFATGQPRVDVCRNHP
jgi:hypothetical protein